MSHKGWSIGVLVAVFVLWFAGTTQHERPLLPEPRTERLLVLERRVAASPQDAALLQELVQAYLDVKQPGLALGALERAPSSVRREPGVEHLFARSLLDQGRSADALASERNVLAICASRDCSAHLVASATRRAEILQELVALGVEDASLHPEASSVAYQNATRQVTLSLR